MLAVFISWIIITFVFVSFGHCFISIINKGIHKNVEYQLIDLFIIGLCITGTVIATSSIWLPSNIYLLTAFIAFSFIYWIFRRKQLYLLIQNFTTQFKSLSTFQIILIALPILLFLIHSVTAPLWVDTPYYHIQNIMWNEQYSVVPGLANLQPRFGFNSNYFLICSTFGLKPLFGQYIFGAHQLCLVYIFSWILYKTFKSNSTAQSIMGLVLFCSFITVYKLHISSPSSDLLPNLLILYLFLKILFDKEAIKKYPIIFVSIPAFCLTLKLSSFIICLFTAYVLWSCIKSKDYRSLSVFIFSALIIIAPWFVRTIYITGYLIFPFPGIDLFSFDWKVPTEYVAEQKDYILAFARVDGYPIEEILPLSLSEWFPRWWKSGMFYYNPYSNRLFFILSLIAILLMPILFVASKEKRKRYVHLFSSWFVALLGFGFWFFSAPDLRFAYGFILPLALFPFYIIIDNINIKYKSKVSFSLIVGILAILFVSLQSVRWAYYQRDTTDAVYNLLYKPQTIDYTKKLKERNYNKKIEFIPFQINNTTIYSATIETHCYDCELPCSSDYTGGLEMRGQTLQDGFRCKPGAPHHRGY